MIDIDISVNSEIIQQSYRLDNSTGNTDFLNSGRGDLSFKGNLIISGIFSGKLIVSGSLLLQKNARVSGEIVVNDMIVSGHLLGSARVINKAVFHSASVFSGTLTASEAEFHRGCKISGKRNIERITEVGDVLTDKNSIYKMDDAALIPDEMNHTMFKSM
jgi:cytoskeletal protein CcmA (bactofilin family)